MADGSGGSTGGESPRQSDGGIVSGKGGRGERRVGDRRRWGEEKRSQGESETGQEEEDAKNKELDTHEKASGGTGADRAGKAGEASASVAGVMSPVVTAGVPPGPAGEAGRTSEKTVSEDQSVSKWHAAKGTAVATTGGEETGTEESVENAGARRQQFGERKTEKRRKPDAPVLRPRTSDPSSSSETRIREDIASAAEASARSQPMFPRGSGPVVAAVVNMLQQYSELATQLAVTRRSVIREHDAEASEFLLLTRELEERAKAGELSVESLRALEDLEERGLALTAPSRKCVVELRSAADKLKTLQDQLSRISRSGKRGTTEVLEKPKDDVAIISQQQHQVLHEAEAAQEFDRVFRQTVSTSVDIELDLIIKKNAEADRRNFSLIVGHGVNGTSAEKVPTHSSAVRGSRPPRTEQQAEEVAEGSAGQLMGASAAAAANLGESPDSPPIHAIPPAIAALTDSPAKQQAVITRVQGNTRSNRTAETTLGGARLLAHISSILTKVETQLVLWLGHYDLDAPRDLTPDEAVARRTVYALISQIGKNRLTLREYYNSVRQAGLLLKSLAP